MSLYGVVTMDIVGSRKIEDRESIQNKLINYINILNEKYSNILPVPIAITLGDEWQLITNHPWKCYDLVHEFQQLLWEDNINLYAGIGIGKINTSLNQDIRKIDGPCFHKAREAINTVKEYYRLKDDVIHSNKNKVYLIAYQEVSGKLNLPFYVDEPFYDTLDPYEEAAFDLDGELSLKIFKEEDKSKNRSINLCNAIVNIINTIIENNEILKQKMTNKQKKIYVDYMKVKSYRKIAEMNTSEGETISSISQKLNTAEFFTIQHNHKTVTELLYNYCKAYAAAGTNI